VHIRQHPRYVDLNRCMACGLCAEKCPRKVKNEFNAGLDYRKAIYIKYPQTVPLKYAIDSANCLYFQKGRCRACEKICPAKAINFQEEPRERNLQVGALVLTPGYEAFDPAPIDIFGYGKYPNIITSLELERLLSASGPSLGHLVRPSDQQPPQKIAFCQCVGSRDINRAERSYCSAICCMSAIKEALVCQEHSPFPLEITIFYIDIRAYGKEFEKYFWQAEKKGIRFVRCRVHSVYAKPGQTDLSIRYLEESGPVKEENFDLVVLSVGLQTSAETRNLAAQMGWALDKHNFIKTSGLHPINTTQPGIFVAGCSTGPKDIPQTVTEASAAAALAMSSLRKKEKVAPATELYPEEKDVRTENPRLGVFICNCGINIGGVVKVPEVVEYARTLPNVVWAQENLFSCSQDAQEKLREVIQKENLNRVVIAACSPRTHEPLFQETLRRSGLNKYLLEMANIRDQCSWVHQHLPQEATQKAKDLVRMAVAKARRIHPLPENVVPVTPRALVIGGGIAGMTAALNLAQQGYEVHLVEKEAHLGGQARLIHKTWQGEDVQSFLKRLISEIEAEKKIRVHLKSEVVATEGFVGNFKTLLSTEEVVHHGVTILATGGQASIPNEYLYGQDSRITLGHELDEIIYQNPERVANWKRAVFILCVGSRIPERPYCSRICCTSTIWRAKELKKINPHIEIFILYRDIRTYGQREELYREARGEDILFIRYDLENKPKVELTNGQLRVTIRDPIVDLTMEIEPDIVNLASAIVPHENEKLARLFKVARNSENFFAEVHAKLRPVEAATEGIFLCGLAHYPKPIDESISQSLAAAARAATILAQKEIRTSGQVASINSPTCIGCQRCLKVCAYEAIDYDPATHTCVVNATLCKGCGACAATCPSQSVQLMGFETRQLYAMIDQALEMAEEDKVGGGKL